MRYLAILALPLLTGCAVASATHPHIDAICRDVAPELRETATLLVTTPAGNSLRVYCAADGTALLAPK